jgi:class 3 adenylate cyclase/tetratricopeptide (TPR) repeat protein
MKCPKCQTENPETRKFCSDCGANLQLICPQCGFENLPKNKFCGGCGHQLEQEAVQKIEPAIEEERKQVTVLFSDLSEYTAMSERLDPEEVKQIMGQIFGEITSAVSKYEGTIEKFIGDAVVAFFGVPKVHEDDPVRAIRTAIEIHELVNGISPHFESRVGKPLAMHTGINTGLVVTGEVTTGKGILGVTGDTVNVASRLSTLAKPGEILVGQDTNRQAEWLFNFAPLSPVIVKGKAEPVQVYRVAGIKEKKGRSLGVDSPLVGREKEMGLLSLQVLRLINGTGGIVTVSGEAGIGKSRLLAELRLTEPIRRTILLEGRALSMGRGLSFYPIIDALKHWSQIKENDTDTEAQRKLEKAIRDIHPEEAGEIFPFIATLMGMKLTGKHAERVKGIEGESLEKLIFKNMRELLIKGSELRPMVIYIEDFHLVDTSSLELIEALFRLVEEYRILFILVFRPGYTDTGERITAFIQENHPSNWTKIELEPLKESESEQLFSNLLQIKSFPHQLREQILQRAGGNPFFIEEVVRSLINEGAVVQERGEYRVTEKIKNIVIPQSIHALIMTRIDRLDEETRNLVKVASVIGRNFFYRILTEVASYIEEVDRRLDYLKEIQLIRERKRMEEVEYLFKHALAQEAAYESILIQRRKEIHQKVAQSIEKVFNERLHEFYGMLAYHYGMGEDLDKAEEYMIRAGEEAMKSAASSEALNYFEEALAVYRSKFGEKVSPEKIAMLEKNIAYALYNKGEQIKAVNYLTKVLEYHGETFPKTAVGTALKCVNGLLQLLIGIYLPKLKWKRIPDEKDKEIIELQGAKAKALGTSVPKRFMIESFFMLPRFTAVDISRIEQGFGKLAAFSVLFSFPGISATISRRILTFTKDKIGKNDDESYYYWLMSEMTHKLLVDDFDLSHIDIASFKTLTEKMLRVGVFFEVVYQVSHLGRFFIERGDFEKARDMVGLLGRVGAEYENDHAKVYQLLLEVRLSIEQGRLKEAIDAAHKGILLAERLELGPDRFSFLTLKARAHVLLGDQEGSETCFKYLEEIKSNTYLIPYYLSDYVAVRSMYSVACLEEAVNNGDTPHIRQLARESWKWGREALKATKKFKRDRVEVLRLLGTYFWLTKKYRKALKWWTASVETGERLKLMVDLSRTYFEIGKRLSELNSPFKELNGISPVEYLSKAKTMFEKMNLQRELEQLEHVNSPEGLFQGRGRR